MENSRRGIGRDGVRAAVVTDGAVLFARNGSFNAILAQQLKALADGSARTNDKSTSAQIKVANGALLPRIRMFESLGSSEGFYQDPNPKRFSNLLWDLTYISHTQTGTILTFWANGAYRTQRFNGLDSTYNANNLDWNVAAPTATVTTNTAYPNLNVASNAGCELRNVIMNDFCSFLTTYFPTVVDYIVRPVRLGWQNNDAMNGARADDLIWVPSYKELATTFGMNDNDRVGVQFSTANCFTRTAYPSAFNGAGCVFACTTSSGGVGGMCQVATAFDVRPALHIDISALNVVSYLSAGFASGAVTGAGAGVTVN